MRRIALALPHVEEGTWHGLQVLKVKGKLFVRLREDLDSIAIRMPLDLREEMMLADSDTYYVTDLKQFGQSISANLGESHQHPGVVAIVDCVWCRLHFEGPNDMIPTKFSRHLSGISVSSKEAL